MKNDIFFCHRIFPNPLSIPLRPHAHDLWEFLYIIQGNVNCMIEGKRYPVENHSLIVIRPAQVHRMHLIGDCPYEYCSLMCDVPALFPELAAQVPDDIRILNFGSDTTVTTIFDRMKGRYDGGNTWMPAIEELLIRVKQVSAREQRRQPLSEHPLVSDAIAYIESNIHTMSRLGEVYERLGISRGRLYDLFIKHMLISPKKYVQVKRMALLQMYLRNEQTPEALLPRYGYKDKETFKKAHAQFYSNVP